MARLPYSILILLSAVFVVALSQATTARGDSLDVCLAEAWLPRQVDCLTEIAIEMGDPALCLQSEELAVRWQCVAFYAENSGDAAQCEIIPDNELDPAGVAQDLCHMHLAVAWRAPAECENLATPNLGDSCLLKLVELGEDRMLCERIKNETLAAACREF